MYFKNIIGHQNTKSILTEEARNGRTPHARMICGQAGTGALPIAISYARYLVCEHRTDTDACGKCADCRMMDAWGHPDIHFVFPVVKRNGKDTISDDLIKDWRSMMSEIPYAGIDTWLSHMGSENQQAQIYVKESDAILRKLSLKPVRGKWKVVIIWLPEKMNAECANRLLKILEEPPAGTAFMLVTEEPEALLSTIRSRTQRMDIPAIDEESITTALTERFGIETMTAQNIAHSCGGNWTVALEAIHTDEEGKLFFELFISLMRLAYARRIREMKEWSETMATLGRERQKRFLQYATRMVRENFVSNFGLPAMVTMNTDEQEFARRFAPFVNERNICGMAFELEEAENHIARNVNARMVFFDLALKLIVLLVKK